MTQQIRYFARHEMALQHGCFFRVSEIGITQYSGGHFTGFKEKLPDIYLEQPLVEFSVKHAERLLQGCWHPKGSLNTHSYAVLDAVTEECLGQDTTDDFYSDEF